MPPQQLPPIAEEGESRAGEGVSGEDESSQCVGRMEDLDSESDLDMTRGCPPVPPATREAPAAEPGAEAGRGAEGNRPTPSVSPGRADFSGINGSSSSSSSDDTHTSSDNSNSNDRGDLPALVGRPRYLEGFGKLPALQSGRTRSQSWGLTMSASYADVLLTYAMRTVEAKRAVEKGPRKSNELTIHYWKSVWRRIVSGPKSLRDVVPCWNSARTTRTRTVPS